MVGCAHRCGRSGSALALVLMLALIADMVCLLRRFHCCDQSIFHLRSGLFFGLSPRVLDFGYHLGYAWSWVVSDLHLQLLRFGVGSAFG